MDFYKMENNIILTHYLVNNPNDLIYILYYDSDRNEIYFHQMTIHLF